MNLTLTTLSCAPRVFEIKNFSSDLEVDHLLGIADQKTLDVLPPARGGVGIYQTMRRDFHQRLMGIPEVTILLRTPSIDDRPMSCNEGLCAYGGWDGQTPEFSESMRSLRSVCSWCITIVG
jgi:hypothetical protein